MLFFRILGFKLHPIWWSLNRRWQFNVVVGRTSAVILKITTGVLVRLMELSILAKC